MTKRRYKDLRNRIDNIYDMVRMHNIMIGAIKKQIGVEDPDDSVFNDLKETLEDVMNQACYVTDGDEYHIDSMGTSGYAYALRLLARLGRFEILKEHGRRVIGKWKVIEPDKPSPDTEVKPASLEDTYEDYLRESE